MPFLSALSPHLKKKKGKGQPELGKGMCAPDQRPEYTENAYKLILKVRRQEHTFHRKCKWLVNSRKGSLSHDKSGKCKLNPPVRRFATPRREGARLPRAGAARPGRGRAGGAVLDTEVGVSL